MKVSKLLVLCLAVVALFFAALLFGPRLARNGAGDTPRLEARAAAAAGEALGRTPADRRISAGEGEVRRAPDRPEGYNLLAAAYMQKARETGDLGFDAKAEGALAESFRVAPDNFDALKLRAKLLLVLHRFEEALEVSLRARGQRPTDHDVYGALTDSYVELGRYDEAVVSAQRMVDLRPDAASYARVSYLRELHGDLEGAAEAMAVAVKAADPRDPQSVAWARTNLGDLLFKLGRRAEAERLYESALQAFPGHEGASMSKAQARAAAGDLEGAVEEYRRIESHDARLALAGLYTKLGRPAEAEAEYATFEQAEREAAAQENDTSHLTRFWADRGTNLDEALELTRRERSRRADVYTCDALAWVLYRRGMLEEARAAMAEALRLGTRDPKLSYHAGMIYRALGDRRRAAEHLALALELNPAFDLAQADEARAALAELRPRREAKTARN